VGNFNGTTGLAVPNAGSNSVTVISNLAAASPRIQSVATGGQTPIAGFVGDFTNNGFTDLVVANNGDGQFSLFLGGAGGLSLAGTLVDPAVPNPTAMSFAGLEDGVLSFYATTEGREAAFRLSFELEGSPSQPGGPSPEPGGPASEPGGPIVVVVGPASGPAALPGLFPVPGVTVVLVAQLGQVSGTALDLVATLVTLTVAPGSLEGELGATSGGGGTELLAVFAPGGSVGFGQGSAPGGGEAAEAAGEPEPAKESDASAAGGGRPASAAVERLAPWARLAAGLEEAWEELRARLGGGERSGTGPNSGPAEPAGDGPRAHGQGPAPATGARPSQDPPRPGSVEGVERPRPAPGREATGAARAGLPRRSSQPISMPRQQPEFPAPAASAVDAAIEAMDPVVPTAVSTQPMTRLRADQNDARDQALREMALTTLALLLASERAVDTARSRRRAQSTASRN
jgi:hypothetical protein